MRFERPHRFSCALRAMLAAVVLLAPAAASAQVTLVVRSGGEVSRALDGAIDEALRANLGGSVRHVDPTLDDLALAAGCETATTSATCVSTVADAADARLVAIESLGRDGAEWRVHIDLRRADGTRVRELSVRCDDARTCAAELGAALGAEQETTETDTDSPAPTSVSYVPRHGETSSSVVAHAPTEPARHGETATATPTPHSDGPSASSTDGPTVVRLVPTALFVGAGLAGIGAAIAGGISVQSANDAAGLGVLRSEAQVDHEQSLEQQRDVALGVGIGLACVGAGLAIAGAFTFADESGPTLRIGLLDASLSVDF